MKLLRVALALGLATTVVLAGCSAGGPSSGGTDGSGQSGASDGGTESGTGTGTDVDADSDTESGPSGAPDGLAGKPPTFPADVPIIDGDVVFGVDLGTGWTVVVQADDIVAAYTDAAARLTGAGYTAQVTSTEPTGSFGSYSNDRYTIQVTSTDTADYGPSVTYVVILTG